VTSFRASLQPTLDGHVILAIGNVIKNRFGVSAAVAWLEAVHVAQLTLDRLDVVGVDHPHIGWILSVQAVSDFQRSTSRTGKPQASPEPKLRQGSGIVAHSLPKVCSVERSSLPLTPSRIRLTTYPATP